MEKTLHIGKMVQEYIDAKNFKRTMVAQILGVPNTAIYAYEKRHSLQTSNLLRICHALKYNFYMDVANSLPKEYAHSELLVSEKDELIDKQAAEIQKLKLENDLLKDLITTRKN